MVWHANLACREACFSPDARTNLHEKSRLVIGRILRSVPEYRLLQSSFNGEAQDTRKYSELAMYLDYHNEVVVDLAESFQGAMSLEGFVQVSCLRPFVEVRYKSYNPLRTYLGHLNFYYFWFLVTVPLMKSISGF